MRNKNAFDSDHYQNSQSDEIDIKSLPIFHPVGIEVPAQNIRIVNVDLQQRDSIDLLNLSMSESLSDSSESLVEIYSPSQSQMDDKSEGWHVRRPDLKYAKCKNQSARLAEPDGRIAKVRA